MCRICLYSVTKEIDLSKKIEGVEILDTAIEQKYVEDFQAGSTALEEWAEINICAKKNRSL